MMMVSWVWRLVTLELLLGKEGYEPSTPAVTRLRMPVWAHLRRRTAVGVVSDGVLIGALVGGAIVAALTVAALLGEQGIVVGQVIALAVVGWLVLVFGLLVAGALERKKLMEYKTSRRELRFALRYVNAERELYRRAVESSAALRRGDADEPTVQRELIRVADALQDVLAAAHDQTAVAVVLRKPDLGLHQVIHLAASPSSRWRQLRPGKSCPMRGQTFDKALKALAPHTWPIPLGVTGLDLWVGVLSWEAFSTDDKRVFDEALDCFSAVARELDARPSLRRQLRAVR